jgi:hypothetical protein
LSKEERKELLYRRKVEKCVALFLDLDHDRTWANIAQEMGVSVNTVYKITKTELFQNLYNEHYVELGHDPRLRAYQQSIVDMVPKAIRTINELMMDASVSGGVRLNAAKEIMRLAGVEAVQSKQNDKSELQKFLSDKGISVDAIDVRVEVSPLRNAQELLSSPPLEIVDGSFEDSTDEDLGDEP